MRVLVVEDYPPLRTSVARGLREAGHAVDVAADGTEGLALATASDYDVVVLDLMLPGTDGLTVLRTLRARRAEARVLILTARDGLKDRVRGLDLGADDYLVKPFALEELLARVRALVRRRYGAASPVVRIAGLEIDTGGRVVLANGERVDLTAREYSILEVLALRAGRIVTREEISEHVYDWAADVASNVVDVYVGYLRRKLGAAGLPPLIRTHRGIGYSLGEPGE
jgi:DNA-binding response OmpR family regulator